MAQQAAFDRDIEQEKLATTAGRRESPALQELCELRQVEGAPQVDGVAAYDGVDGRGCV